MNIKKYRTDSEHHGMEEYHLGEYCLYKDAESAIQSIQVDTLDCWIGTRLKSGSASIMCPGNVSIQLLRILDEKLLPIIDKTN